MRLNRLGLVVALAALLGAGCGQYAGVHKDVLTFDEQPASRSRPANNGENGPLPRYIKHTVITVTTIGGGSRGAKGKAPSGGKVPLRLCPVQGKGFFGDDFGAPRYAGGFHYHAGNDIFAARGTPIVAPFDGIAVQTPNSLGGLAVKVFGKNGYVYNAHLAGYGQLGLVKAGAVIGYVGNSGDALGGPMHDHFEWHPNARPANLWTSPFGLTLVNGAVDPYPFLNAVCR